MEKQLRCPRCKKKYIFLGTGNPTFCPECITKDREDYYKVREYIVDHPGVDMYKVNEATQVPIQKIMRYIREELIEIAPGSNSFLHCDMCGKIINTGYMCEDCKRKYGNKDTKRMSAGINLDGKMHTGSNNIKQHK